MVTGAAIFPPKERALGANGVSDQSLSNRGLGRICASSSRRWLRAKPSTRATLFASEHSKRKPPLSLCVRRLAMRDVPKPIEGLSRYPELDNEVARIVLRLCLAALL